MTEAQIRGLKACLSSVINTCCACISYCTETCAQKYVYNMHERRSCRPVRNKASGKTQTQGSFVKTINVHIPSRYLGFTLVVLYYSLLKNRISYCSAKPRPILISRKNNGHRQLTLPTHRRVHSTPVCLLFSVKHILIYSAFIFLYSHRTVTPLTCSSRHLDNGHTKT